MIIQILGYNEKLKINNGEIGTLNVNNTKIYKLMLYSLTDKIKFDENNNIVFLDNEKRIKYDDFLYIDNLLTYKLDNKKIISKIINGYISLLNFDQDKYYSLTESINKLYKDMNTFLQENEYDYDFYEFQIQNVLKTINIEFNIEYDNLAFKLDSIVNIYTKLFSTKFIIINNVSQVLEKEETEELQKIARKFNIILLLLENNKKEELKAENLLNISEDYGVYATNNT